MENALIISSIDKGTAFFAEVLSTCAISNIVALKTCAGARRMLIERDDFDLAVINAPLKDESGERLACEIASKGAMQVILVAKADFCQEVSAFCEETGVLTVTKPVNRDVFCSALKFARAMQKKLRAVHAENVRLRQKIEDLRIVDRAKCILISYMNMDEKEAHRYIEKQAMDMRSTKRVIAEKILMTYEN